MTEPPADTRSLLRAASDHAHWLIQLADTKASYLMAASAILAGLLAQQTVFGCDLAARAVLFLAIALALGCSAATLMVLVPRIGPRASSSLVYFRAVQEFSTSAEYYARVQGLTASDTDRELAQQVWELAPTQERKFYWLRWAFLLFGACLIAGLVGVVWVHLPCA